MNATHTIANKISAPQQVIKVALPVPLHQWFDYKPSANQPNPPEPGCRVLAPFGNRKLVGIVIGYDESSATDPAKLKPIIEQIDQTPIMPKSLIQLCKKISSYYHHPLGEVLHFALPKRIRQAKTLAATPPLVKLTLKGELLEIDTLNKAPKQQSALSILRNHPLGLHAPLLTALGVSSQTRQALLQKSLIEISAPQADRTTPVEANQVSSKQTIKLLEPHLPFSQAQQEAFDSIQANMQENRCMLLEGITGSGKTEIYLQLIETMLKEDFQVLVMVPEIGLTPQTLNRFQDRYGTQVVALHSKLSESAYTKAWCDIASGKASIIVGTRSCLFAPMIKPGFIIVDEEHDGSYKSHSLCKYHARDMAVLKGQLEKIPVLLGSATPAFESLNNALTGKYAHILLSERAGLARPPQMNLIDLRELHLDSGLAEPTLKAIRKTLEAKQQVLVFLNRRGYAPTLICHGCGWTATCEHCDARMTLHLKKNRLKCHHCSANQSIPTHCPTCKHTDIRPLGAGTEKIEAALSNLFPETPLLRIDRDSTTSKHAMKQHTDQIHQNKPLIMVGTQMIAKGHHFPKVTLVVMLNMDHGFFTVDFRGPEHAAQLITQVAGRAGRAEDPGRVLIQTHHPEHEPLNQLLEKGYGFFARTMLSERNTAQLPPFVHLAAWIAESQNSEAAELLLEGLSNEAHLQEHQGFIWGPLPMMMTRKAGMHRHQLILGSNSRRDLHQSIHQLQFKLEQIKPPRHIRISLDVDPVSL